MANRLKYIFFAAVVLSVYSPVKSAEIIELAFVTAVNDRTGPGTKRDSENNLTLQNPFSDTLFAQLGNDDHFASSSISLSWLHDTGLFSINFQDSVPSENRDALSTGGFYLQTNSDLLVNLSGVMDFASAEGEQAQFLFRFDVADDATNTPYFSFLENGGDLGIFDPPSGSLSFNATDIFLPGGATYEISYLARNTASRFPDDIPNNTSGFINLDFRSVPEPNTALLLLCAASFTIASRRHVSFPMIDFERVD